MAATEPPGDRTGRRIVALYRDGWSTRRIAAEVGVGRQQVTAVLRDAQVAVADRGRGRARPQCRVPDPADMGAVLRELYVDRRLGAAEVAALLGMSERTVRCRLEEYGIARRSRGRGNREDRVILDSDRVARLYLGEGLSADQVGAVFGCSRSVVLRCLRDAGLPVRCQWPSESPRLWAAKVPAGGQRSSRRWP